MTIHGRKSHVKRCLGVTKNSDGTTDENTEMWLDILRLDEFVYTDSDGQGYRFIIKWSDDTLKEDADDYDNVAHIDRRKTELGKATDPELPFDPDPSEYVPFRAINELVIRDSAIGQEIKYLFKNKNSTPDGVPIPTSRAIDTIRLYHSSTTADDALNSTDPPNDTHIVSDEQYALVADTQDKSQYADMEVIRNWTHAVHEGAQEFKVVLHNADIYKELLGIDIPDVISPGTNSSGNPTIAGRMDPFQNVLNAQWNPLPQVVLGSKGVGLFGSSIPKTEYSKDGSSWSSLSANSTSAASGLGYTVIADVGGQIVFGKPRDGVSCFMYISGTDGNVKRGVLDDRGNLTWTTVVSLGGNASSVSFAGGAFFVAYQPDNDSWLAVSFNGKDFTTVDVFSPPAGSGGTTGGPVGGTVAYDSKNKVYVTCGNYTWQYTFDFFGSPRTASEQNFMSATSIDGLTWGNKFYDQSEATGPILGDGLVTSAIGAAAIAPTVTFGAGIFVAVTYMKWRFLDSGQQIDLLETLAGFATSTDGVTWTNHRLPSITQNVGSPTAHLGPVNSTSQCIQFYKTGGTDINGYPKGFFLIGVWETQLGLGSGAGSVSGFINPIHKQKIYKSLDGLAWELVRTADDFSASPQVLSTISKSFNPDTSRIAHV